MSRNFTDTYLQIYYHVYLFIFIVLCLTALPVAETTN